MNNWKEEIQALITERIALQNVTRHLLLLKEQNVKQSDVMDYLTEFRESDFVLNDDIDDWVLEILDIVSGHCKEEYRVW